TPELSQHAIRKYAEAFEVIPRTLAESAGLDATEVLARLYASHHKAAKAAANQESDTSSGGTSESSEESDDDEEEDDEWTLGVDIENEDGTGTLDAKEEGILDLLITKQWAVRLATEAARTVLSVDQIIVARQAGGPKPPGPNPNWDED
ncbi:MAG: hypothetical protein L6R35_007558, partial [Caloplaca aegaea]